MFTLRNILIGGAIAAVVIVAAGAAGWYFFVREDAELATNAPAIPSDLQDPRRALRPRAPPRPR